AGGPGAFQSHEDDETAEDKKQVNAVAAELQKSRAAERVPVQLLVVGQVVKQNNPQCGYATKRIEGSQSALGVMHMGHRFRPARVPIIAGLPAHRIYDSVAG